MHAVLSSIGTDGDVFPFIGLANALRRRGHRVTLIAANRYQKTASELDLEFVAVLSEAEMLEVLTHRHMWHPVFGPNLMAKWGSRFIARQYQLLDEVCGNDSLMIMSPAVLSAKTLHDKRNVPIVSVVLQPWMIKSSIAPPIMPARLTLPAGLPKPVSSLYWSAIQFTGQLLIGGKLHQHRKPLNLPRVKRIFDWWFSRDLVLGLFPDWYGPRQADWELNIDLCGFPLFDGRVDQSLPTETEAFCKAGPPPIAFTFGTGMMHAQRLFAAAVEACRTTGLRAILLTSHATQLPSDMPDFIHRCSYAPFGKLFPLCSAVVHHGGIGTAAKAFAAGVPQLVVPIAYDQLDNATRVKSLGAGDFIKPAKLSIHGLADKVRLIQNKEVIARCRELAARIAQTDALQTASHRLEKYWESIPKKR